MGHCWSRDKLINDILLWIPSHWQTKAGRPARTYIQQLCAATGCSLEDLLGVMDDREGWQERVREICTGGAAWWWWVYKSMCYTLIIMVLNYGQYYISMSIKNIFFVCFFYRFLFQSIFHVYTEKLSITQPPYYFTPCEFFTPVLTGGFLMKAEWQQVPSDLQNISQYSGQSQQCYNLDCLNSSFDFQFFQSLFHAFGEHSKCTNYNWYHCHSYIPQLFFLVLWQGTSICLSLCFLYFHFVIHWNGKIPKRASSFFVHYF